MIIKHKQGRHRSWPYIFKKVKGGLIYSIKFTNSCRYNHGDIDQYDWNKLFGLKRYYFFPRYTSTMWAWRYVAGKFHIGSYSHLKGSTMMPEEWMEVDAGQEVVVAIPGSGWLLNPWFGGQKKAPHNMSIIINFI